MRDAQRLARPGNWTPLVSHGTARDITELHPAEEALELYANHASGGNLGRVGGWRIRSYPPWWIGNLKG
ncbi:MAG: hypothetical protein KAX64_04470 [Chromatiaceae bacterium]|nr:hypothetical protein [Chromatiaceae bacterium]MBP8283274.1 hypothetical protein [Chromatiaceae bacterium]